MDTTSRTGTIQQKTFDFVFVEIYFFATPSATVVQRSYFEVLLEIVIFQQLLFVLIIEPCCAHAWPKLAAQNQLEMNMV